MAGGEDPPELWLVRHGETEWTLSRRHTGTTDVPLTEHGREQAAALEPRLQGQSFDLVLSSPLSRAHETARLAGFEPELSDALVEMRYGEYEGITTAEIRLQRPDWDLWTDGNPGGETVNDVGVRVTAVFERIRSAGAKRVLVFGHGHCLRILAACWLGLPAREGRVLVLAPASVGVLGSEHDRAAVVSWGASAHG